jgi:hypothetical protein
MQHQQKIAEQLMENSLFDQFTLHENYRKKVIPVFLLF